MSFLELDSVSKRFGDHLAVEDLRLSVAKGEFISLLGPSGCGKTTTLQMIAGFVDLTTGAIRLDSRDLASVKPAKRGLGIVFQSYALFPHMTAAENVAFGLEMRGVQRAERETRVRDVLAMVGLAGYEGRHPRRMSGGQQQRVALARAIVIKPEVLLLDEPLSNLDANLREEMRFEIRRLHDEFRITTVYVTHDQAEAMVTSDRIAVMNQGRIEQVDEPHALYTRPKTRFVAGFIGRTNFVEGTADGSDIVFDHFAVPKAAVADAASLSGKVTFSVRPQSLSLARAPTNGGPGVEVKVVERAYLGEFWDYVVVPVGGTMRLKVTTPPLAVHEVGETAWLGIDPRQITPIS